MPVEYPLSTPTSDERTLAVLAHILAIVPGIGIFGPLIIYLIRRDGPSFVTENAKESLNFQDHPLYLPHNLRDPDGGRDRISFNGSLVCH